jgi:hypothetical protein
MREGKSPNAEVAMVAYPEIFGKLLEEMVGFYMMKK